MVTTPSSDWLSNVKGLVSYIKHVTLLVGNGRAVNVTQSTSCWHQMAHRSFVGCSTVLKGVKTGTISLIVDWNVLILEAASTVNTECINSPQNYHFMSRFTNKILQTLLN